VVDAEWALERGYDEIVLIGHSNNTYILGQSLRGLSSMKFKNVALAGSVLPRDFSWRELMSGNDPQVERLRNDCANTDWPVGFLCSGLRGLRRKDIGTGGYEGFLEDDEKMLQYWFHSSSKPKHLVKEKPAFSLLSRLAPWLFRILVVILFVVLAFALWNQNVNAAIAAAAILTAIYITLKVL